MSKYAINIFIIMLIFVSYASTSSSFLKKSTLTEEELQIISTKAYEAFCFLNVNGTVYDLNSLNNPVQDYNTTDNKFVLHYNFCKQAVTQCPLKNTTALAVMTSKADKNICYALGGSESTLTKWNFNVDTATNITSLELILSEGENCKNDPNKKFQTVYEIVCDEKAETPRLDTTVPFNSDNCINKIRLYSKAGCPQINFYSLFNTIISNKFIFGPILIGLGIFLCFFGNYFYFILSLIAGVCVVSFLFLFLIFSNIKIAFSTTIFWVVICAVVILGILAGWFISKHEWLIDIILGGIAGYLLGLFLYNFCLNRIGSNPKLVYWMTLVGSIVLVIVLVLLIKSFIVIVCTSFIGAYGIIRGLSLMLGGFPDENQVMDLISRKEWAQVQLLLSPAVYMYLVAFVIFGIAGTIIQYKYFNRADKAEKKNEGSADEKENLVKK